MERELILKRLSDTIARLEVLLDENFLYQDFVTKMEDGPDGRICGTVCCVAGWYPKWFPESNLRYSRNFLLVNCENSHMRVTDTLVLWHGLPSQTINMLFLGERAIVTIEKEREHDIRSKYENSIEFRDTRSSNQFAVGLRSGLASDRKEASDAFRMIHEIVSHVDIS